MESSVHVVLVSVPDGPSGLALARQLVEEQLAACGTVLSGATSVYRWEGRVEVADEAVLLLKCAASSLGALLERVPALHPYDVPEILALPVVTGHPPYLAWVLDACGSGETGA
jgi:periplasmic divalent cation tolerance protein